MQTIPVAWTSSHGNAVTQPSSLGWLTSGWPIAQTNWFAPIRDPRPSATVSQGRVWIIPSKQTGQLRLLSSLLVSSPVPANESRSLYPCSLSCSFSSLLKIHFSHNKCCESENYLHTRSVWTLISQLRQLHWRHGWIWTKVLWMANTWRCVMACEYWRMPGYRYVAMQRYYRHQDNISPEGLEKKKVFMWFPYHEWRLHCLENIPWQLDFATMAAQDSILPAAGRLETRVVCDGTALPYPPAELKPYNWKKHERECVSWLREYTSQAYWGCDLGS